MDKHINRVVDVTKSIGRTYITIGRFDNRVPLGKMYHHGEYMHPTNASLERLSRVLSGKKVTYMTPIIRIDYFSAFLHVSRKPYSWMTD